MGILKYYSPYIENSIKIKIDHRNNEELFSNEIIDRLKIFSLNLDTNEEINKKNKKKKFENIKNIKYHKGVYHLTLFYNGLLKDMNNLFENCLILIMLKK